MSLYDLNWQPITKEDIALLPEIYGENKCKSREISMTQFFKDQIRAGSIDFDEELSKLCISQITQRYGRETL